MGTALPLIAINLCAKLFTGRTDGQSGDYMIPPLGSIHMLLVLPRL